MKLKPGTNIPDFLLAVQNCRGDVYFTTPEGDKLNLKSMLSQFVFAAVIAGQLGDLQGEIEMQDSSDLAALQGYLM